MSHIAVERNRRRQMNEHLKVLRSLTPCFYIKRGDQASIIGGVVEFINELHQVLQALESQKRRKSLSPSPGPSPRTLQPTFYQFDCSSGIGTNAFKELGASCNSSVADVEVKISGPNVILKVISHRIPGQVAKIITVLESLSFEVLHLNISSMEETVLYQFVVKNLYTHKIIIKEGNGDEILKSHRAGMSTKSGGTSDGSTTKLLFRGGYEVNCAVMM